MAYHLPDDASLEAMIDYVVRVQAGLQTKPTLHALEAPWFAFEADLEAQKSARDTDRKHVIRASAKVRVARTDWSIGLTDVSGRSWELSKKKAGNLPHSVLFGATAAADTKGWGPDRCVPHGSELVAKGTALKMPALDEKLTPFAALNTALHAVDDAHAAAETQLRTHGAHRAASHARLEHLIATTEADILKVYPGNDDLISAILSPHEPAKKKAKPAPPKPAA